MICPSVMAPRSAGDTVAMSIAFLGSMSQRV